MWDAERGQETIRRPGECAGGIACLAEPLCLCGGKAPRDDGAAERCGLIAGCRRGTEAPSDKARRGEREGEKMRRRASMKAQRNQGQEPWQTRGGAARAQERGGEEPGKRARPSACAAHGGRRGPGVVVVLMAVSCFTSSTPSVSRPQVSWLRALVWHARAQEDTHSTPTYTRSANGSARRRRRRKETEGETNKCKPRAHGAHAQEREQMRACTHSNGCVRWQYLSCIARFCATQKSPPQLTCTRHNNEPHSRTRTHACTQARMHKRTHAHARTRTHTHAHARAHTHTHANTHAHAHTHTRTHTHTHTYTHKHRHFAHRSTTSPGVQLPLPL